MQTCFDHRVTRIKRLGAGRARSCDRQAIRRGTDLRRDERTRGEGYVTVIVGPDLRV
jgi:hypothetical protein